MNQFFGLASSLRTLDLRAKISLVILGVLVPVFLLVTIIVSEILKPNLSAEIRQIGISSGQTIAKEIMVQRLIAKPNAEKLIEDRLREFIYMQPNIRRLDVFVNEPVTGLNRLIASTLEEVPGEVSQPIPLVEQTQATLIQDRGPGENGWDILVPIENNKHPPQAVGTVRVFVSTQLINRLMGTFTRITVVGALFGIILLFLMLNFALRRTVENDRKLREAESENLQLSRQLHETQRQLMNTEKLAVMGQLTARFAHEIGTPLNAIGGHLTLIQEDAQSISEASGERIRIIEGQVGKIADIVKGFLQSTAKPASQKQLIDPHLLIERTLSILRPRIEALGVEIRRRFDRNLGPIRMVPVELEQILLNLLNNSLDSIKAKSEYENRAGSIQVSTVAERKQGQEFLMIAVRDTGQGIVKEDLPKVLKPFYTTKAPGEGTGLGLAICEDLVRKYGGALSLESQEGDWTKVELQIPYNREG